MAHTDQRQATHLRDGDDPRHLRGADHVEGNALTAEKLTDMGNSATFYSVLVEVELSTAGGWWLAASGCGRRFSLAVLRRSRLDAFYCSTV